MNNQSTIIFWRTLKGISRRELARRLGVTCSTWRRMELGLSPIKPELLPRLTEELAPKPADLGVPLAS